MELKDEFKSGWTHLMSEFVEAVVGKIITPINQSIKYQTHVMIRKFYGTLFFLAGGILLLQGLAFAINDLFSRPGWFGFVIIGLPVMLLGIILKIWK